MDRLCKGSKHQVLLLHIEAQNISRSARRGSAPQARTVSRLTVVLPFQYGLPCLPSPKGEQQEEARTEDFSELALVRHGTYFHGQGYSHMAGSQPIAKVRKQNLAVCPGKKRQWILMNRWSSQTQIKIMSLLHLKHFIAALHLKPQSFKACISPQPSLSTPRTAPSPYFQCPSLRGPVLSVAFSLIFPPSLWPQTLKRCWFYLEGSSQKIHAFP